MREEYQHMILKKLEDLYQDAVCQLDFRSAFELLIATILSAQCTDKRVNIVTSVLFEVFKTPKDYAELTPVELEPYIKSCGVYHNKARNIVATCRKLLHDFHGEVPRTREELMTLPGVGRKTANVVMANAFGEDAIAVDTHVFRVSNRLGLAHAKDPLNTEKQLMEVIDKEKWSAAHHWIIWHGRQVCSARKPKCPECQLAPWCQYYSRLVD